MLLSKGNYDNFKSKFICDMCGKEIYTGEAIKISVKTPIDTQFKKRYDLCKKCDKVLISSVEKYRRKSDERNDNIWNKNTI